MYRKTVLRAITRNCGNRERLYYSFSDAIAEIFSIQITACVHERQDGNRVDAVTMVGVHLGLTSESELSHAAFLENFQKLKTLARFDCGNPELDRYLWLAGQLRAFKEDSAAKINKETRRLFQESSIEEKELLARLERGSVTSG